MTLYGQNPEMEYELNTITGGCAPSSPKAVPPMDKEKAADASYAICRKFPPPAVRILLSYSGSIKMHSSSQKPTGKNPYIGIYHRLYIPNRLLHDFFS